MKRRLQKENTWEEMTELIFDGTEKKVKKFHLDRWKNVLFFFLKIKKLVDFIKYHCLDLQPNGRLFLRSIIPAHSFLCVAPLPLPKDSSPQVVWLVSSLWTDQPEVAGCYPSGWAAWGTQTSPAPQGSEERRMEVIGACSSTGRLAEQIVFLFGFHSLSSY